MKVVNIVGGLGNQLFQYAFALALHAEFPTEEIKINTLCFRGYPLHNGYELENLFNVKLRKASVLDLCKVAYPFLNYRLWQIFSRILPQRRSMIHEKQINSDFSYKSILDKYYFDGYWGSPKYIETHREIIKEVFVFPEIANENNLKAVKFIENEKTAFVHIRRGDYLNNRAFGGVCDEQYYRRAINLLIRKHDYKQFIIFSNDIKWCKMKLLELLSNTHVIFVDWNTGKNSYIDMQLMSKCKAGIIANSTFSWWGAWLGNPDIVIAPKHWTNYPYKHEDIFPDSWIRI